MNLPCKKRGSAVVTFTSLIALISTFVLPHVFADTASQPEPATNPSTTTRPALPVVERAYLVTIEGEITNITYDSIKRRLQLIEQETPELVIIELDTPGGVLTTTLDICSKIKSMREEGTAVYAWINDAAYSAGTIIALATDGIVMAGNATIGDCQPIMVTPGGASAVPEDIRGKVYSPLIEELEDSVRRNEYDRDMVMALIDPDMRMFWLENAETGQRRFATEEERDKLFGWPARSSATGLSKLFTTVQPDESQTSWQYVKEVPDFPEYGTVEQPIVDKDQLLTMRTYKARAFGFCEARVDNHSEIREFFNVQGDIIELRSNWIEKSIEWLASPSIRGLLFMLMLLGAYTEFQAPGFGFPGAMAVVALLLFLGAPYLAGYTVTWEILVIFLGMCLIAMEFFVIPGFGIAGIAGIVLLIFGLAASFVPAEPGPTRWFSLPSMPATYEYLEDAFFSLVTAFLGSLVGMYLIMKYLPNVPVFGKAFAPNPVLEEIHSVEPEHYTVDVGSQGEALTLLRPAGRARFGDELVDVVSQGEYIKAGSKIRVVQRHGNRIVVARVES